MSSCRKIQDGVNWKCTQVHGRFTFSLGFKFIVAKLLDINYFEFSKNEHYYILPQNLSFVIAMKILEQKATQKNQVSIFPPLRLMEENIN